MSALDYNPAVRATKRPRVSDGQPWQDDELFPTPPWATRALMQIVLPRLYVRSLGRVWEPCAGTFQRGSGWWTVAESW